VQEALERFPVVGLLGPRQVGKTTLALRVADVLGPERSLYLDLESAVDLAKLSDPEAYLERQRGRTTILDEIHRTPDLFRTLRVLVDRRRREGRNAGHFLVLGSASPELLRQSSESLAGRIAYIELTPVRIDEIAGVEPSLEDLWVRGGFPDSLLAPTDADSLGWRIAFVRTYLERDIPQLGPRVPSETLRRFWTMLAHNQAQTLNASRLAAGLAVSGQTVARYVDLLVDLLLVRRLPAWTGNVGKRLVRSPKVFVRDSGVVHALLRIETADDLLGHPVAGPSWEGMLVETLIGAAGEAACSYYRTSAGAEADLVVEGRGGRRVAIEVKRSTAPAMGRGFRSACEDLRVSAAAVVHGGADRYPLAASVEAVPARGAAGWLEEVLG
jgi:predicted AAA+ superfamily ATPase